MEESSRLVLALERSGMRRKLRNLDEVEDAAEIRRTVPKTPTRADVTKLERKILGRTWGKPRKKMEGWPK